MKRKIILTAWISLLLLSLGCSKAKDIECACGVEDPLENIPWLKENIAERSCVEVYTLNFKSKDYICVNDCPEMRDGLIIIYDCQGRKVCQWGGITPGQTSCFMPSDFSFEYYEKYKRLLYKQDITIR